jgi:hypothetical protein
MSSRDRGKPLFGAAFLRLEGMVKIAAGWDLRQSRVWGV